MKTLKIIHGADVHFSAATQEPALQSLQAMLDHGRENGVDLWALAGDLFDRPVQNTASSGFPRLVRILQAMMDIAPVVAVRGTPSHDAEGCYEALAEINAEHGFTLLDPRQGYYLVGGDVVDADYMQRAGAVGRAAGQDLLILGCPEPSREWFLADKRGLGRDEATQAVNDGMRALLLGWGAVRKQYPDIPCLLLYHGTVRGATLQNGQAVGAGEIALGREDLALVDADYYALGHIHLAQQIGDLPAFYAGSAFPVNWGELDQKGFNAVEISEGQPVLIGRVPLPHPPRRKLQIRFGQQLPQNGEIADRQVWLEICAAREQAGVINREAVLTELMAGGALEGSRVTVQVLPTETVRAEGIAEAEGLCKKVQIYSANSGENIPAGALDKAAALEKEIRAAGAVGGGLHIRIRSLSLRGAIGIHKGQGKDEITLGLDAMEPGLVALLGKNGEGKTTLIENLHPFPELLTRPGKLQDHFRLRDSWRDLTFSDERTGDTYRALIQIDGQNATGRAEYHLYRNGAPITNGRKEEYEQKIGELFGSLALFLRSAFVSQRPSKEHPDLSDATKGEKKALFRELAGLDYLQAASESARERAKTLDREVELATARAESLERDADGAAGAEERRDGLRVEAEALEKKLAEVKAAGVRMKAVLEALAERVEANRGRREQIRAIEAALSTIRSERERLVLVQAEAERALAGRETAQAGITEHTELKQLEGDYERARGDVLKKREEILADYRRGADAAAAAERAVQSQITEKTAALADLRQQKAQKLGVIDAKQFLLAQVLECPKCGHTFAQDEGTHRAELEAAQAAVFNLDYDIAAVEREIAGLVGESAKIVRPAEPELPDLGETDAELCNIRSRLSKIPLATLQATLRAAEEAQARIGASRERLAALAAEIPARERERAQIAAQLVAGVEVEHQVLAAQLETARDEYHAIDREITRLKAEVIHAEKQIEDLRARAAEAAEIRKVIGEKQAEAGAWRFLERACGPDGIQALELDAMGPGIATVANNLLSAAYGSRFQVDFKTTRIGGTGKSKRQIEDFQIWVYDTEAGTEQLFETLSGGESVWIRRALYDAFAIIRDRNTGQRFLTAFQDEADGALDPEARAAYFRMLEAAHRESGRVHTIVITHSESAQEMIGQRIVMRELGVREEVTA
jgi:exonuclease SbcC